MGLITPEFYEKRLWDRVQMAVWDSQDWEREVVKTTSILICRKYITPGMKVLDAGCGVGELIECLPSGVDYLGIDFVPGFIAYARHRYSDHKFEVCNLLDLSRFADDSFDMAVCRSVEGSIGWREEEASGKHEAWLKVMKELLRVAPTLLYFRMVSDSHEMMESVCLKQRETP